MHVAVARKLGWIEIEFFGRRLFDGEDQGQLGAALSLVLPGTACCPTIFGIDLDRCSKYTAAPAQDCRSTRADHDRWFADRGCGSSGNQGVDFDQWRRGSSACRSAPNLYHTSTRARRSLSSGALDGYDQLGLACAA